MSQSCCFQGHVLASHFGPLASLGVSWSRRTNMLLQGTWQACGRLSEVQRLQQNAQPSELATVVPNASQLLALSKLPPGWSSFYFCPCSALQGSMCAAYTQHGAHCTRAGCLAIGGQHSLSRPFQGSIWPTPLEAGLQYQHQHLSGKRKSAGQSSFLISTTLCAKLSLHGPVSLSFWEKFLKSTCFALQSQRIPLPVFQHEKLSQEFSQSQSTRIHKACLVQATSP